MNHLVQEYLKLTEEQAHKISKLIDRMRKMPKEEFFAQAQELLGEKAKMLIDILYVKTLEELIGKMILEIFGNTRNSMRKRVYQPGA